MRKLLIIPFLLIFFSPLTAQEKVTVRYIDVTGKAEAEFEPDEFTLSITIEEYWKEEFQKRTDEKDYRTKIPISQIENDLINALYKADIKKDQISVRNMGNYWRQRGKDFLISKQLEVKLNDFAMVNKLVDLSETKGFKSMYISEMKNTRIDEIEKDVRIKALQNAREKAEYLLESIGQKAGNIISISESLENRFVPYYENMMMRTTMHASADAEMESIDQMKKIKVSYQIFTRFSIAD